MSILIQSDVSFVSYNSRTSLCSVDLIPDRSSTFLISESITLASLSTTSDSSEGAPMYPTNSHSASMVAILGLGSHLPMFPGGISRIGEFSAEDELTEPRISVPTQPRLKFMLKEKLCVNKWVETLHFSETPDHVPWADLQESSSVSWIPEGSIHSPESFRSCLLNARRLREFDAQDTNSHFSSTSLPKREKRRNSYQHKPSSHREALVFEREVTLNQDGKRRRWSLQVPASTMKPEMVDLMIELQDLNSFFKGDLDDIDSSVAKLGAAQYSFVIPSLMMSTSHCEFPLSLESTDNLAGGAGPTSIPLAVRRGKAPPPALSLRRDTLWDTSYPGIPSAFLGSPSTCTPQFELTSAPDEPSMDLEDMLASLRSQCSPLRQQTPDEAEFSHEIHAREALQVPYSPIILDSIPEDPDEDEWAFANSIMKTCNDPDLSLDVAPCLSPSLVGSAPLHAPLLPVANPDPSSPRAFSSAPSSSSPTTKLYTSIKSSLKAPSSIRPHSAASALKLVSRKPITTSRPPSVPLPSRPIPERASSLPAQTLAPRGILKGNKNVRFASLPSPKNEGPDPALVSDSQRTSTPLLTGRLSLGAPLPTKTIPRCPSPLRHVFAPLADPQPQTATPNLKLKPAPAPISTPVKEKSTSKSPLRRFTMSAAAAGRECTAEVKKTKANTKANAKISPSLTTKPTSNTTSLPAVSRLARTASLGRRSLDSQSTSRSSNNKENRSRASSSPTARIWSSSGSGSRSLNENALRRASVVGLAGVADVGDAKHQSLGVGMGTPKGSRMPVPLRNILTRFK